MIARIIGLTAAAAAIITTLSIPAPDPAADNYCPTGCIVTETVNAPAIITQQTRQPWLFPHPNRTTTEAPIIRKTPPRGVP